MCGKWILILEIFVYDLPALTECTIWQTLMDIIIIIILL